MYSENFLLLPNLAIPGTSCVLFQAFPVCCFRHFLSAVPGISCLLFQALPVCSSLPFLLSFVWSFALKTRLPKLFCQLMSGLMWPLGDLCWEPHSSFLCFRQYLWRDHSSHKDPASARQPLYPETQLGYEASHWDASFWRRTCLGKVGLLWPPSASHLNEGSGGSCDSSCLDCLTVPSMSGLASSIVLCPINYAAASGKKWSHTMWCMCQLSHEAAYTARVNFNMTCFRKH